MKKMSANLETSREIRASTRRGEWTKPAVGLARGYAQANLVVLPQELAFEFLLFVSVTLNRARYWMSPKSAIQSLNWLHRERICVLIYQNTVFMSMGS